MVARELPPGPARLSCIYMVFAPYLINFIICTQFVLYTHYYNRLHLQLLISSISAD